MDQCTARFGECSTQAKLQQVMVGQYICIQHDTTLCVLDRPVENFGSDLQDGIALSKLLTVIAPEVLLCIFFACVVLVGVWDCRGLYCMKLIGFRSDIELFFGTRFEICRFKSWWFREAIRSYGLTYEYLKSATKIRSDSMLPTFPTLVVKVCLMDSLAIKISSLCAAQLTGRRMSD